MRAFPTVRAAASPTQWVHDEPLRGVTMWMRRWMWIAWPAFLGAAATQALVFAVFDPYDMRWLWPTWELSRIALYSLSFFALWGIFLFSGCMTLCLSLSAALPGSAPGAAVSCAGAKR